MRAIKAVAAKAKVDAKKLHAQAEKVLMFDAYLHAFDAALIYFGFKHLEHFTILVCFVVSHYVVTPDHLRHVVYTVRFMVVRQFRKVKPLALYTEDIDDALDS